MEDTPPKSPAQVISFKKAVRQIKKDRERTKTSTALPGAHNGQSEIESMILSLIESMRTLHQDHKTLSRRSTETVKQMSECLSITVGMAQDMNKMALRVNILEQEMATISTQLTRALRSNKRLRAQLKKMQTTDG